MKRLILGLVMMIVIMIHTGGEAQASGNQAVIMKAIDGVIMPVIGTVTVSAGTVTTIPKTPGTPKEKSVQFTNITPNGWREVGSITIGAGKTGYIRAVTFTGGNVRYYLWDGTNLDSRIWGETSSGSPAFQYQCLYPVGRIAGTVIRTYAYTADSVNEGTFRIDYTEE